MLKAQEPNVVRLTRGMTLTTAGDQCTTICSWTVKWLLHYKETVNGTCLHKTICHYEYDQKSPLNQMLPLCWISCLYLWETSVKFWPVSKHQRNV